MGEISLEHLFYYTTSQDVLQFTPYKEFANMIILPLAGVHVVVEQELT